MTKADISVYKNHSGGWVCAYVGRTERVSKAYYFYTKAAAIRLFLDFLKETGYDKE
jgi:hypothetical protein